MSYLPIFFEDYQGYIYDLGAISNKRKKKFSIDPVKLEGFKSSSETKKGQFTSASEFGFSFKTNEKQNLYIKLEDLQADWDLYLAPTRPEQPLKGFPIEVSTQVVNSRSSTHYGNEDELIFSALPAGRYFLSVKKNPWSPGDENLNEPFSLILNSKIFDQQTTLPNDKYLTDQWYLFNNGQFEDKGLPAVALGEKADGIKPNQDIFAPEAWKINHDAEDIVVAIVDSGVEIEHPDLKQNIWINTAELNGIDGEDDDENGYDDDIFGWNFVADNNNPNPLPTDNGHGTHVAGTVGAVGNNNIGVSGVAWDVKLMAINVANEERQFLHTDKAIEYAAKNGAAIINCSFGMNLKRKIADVALYVTSKGRLTEDAPEEIKAGLKGDIKALNMARKYDSLIIFAAGNENSYHDELFRWKGIGNLDDYLSPSNFIGHFHDNVIIVSATDGTGKQTPYSNIGETIDISAPGGNTNATPKLGILSTVPSFRQISWDSDAIIKTENSGNYDYMQGTSMAAPVVSGAAALVLSTNPELSAPEVSEVLKQSAIHDPNLKGIAGKDGLRLNLEHALKLASEWQGVEAYLDTFDGTPKADILVSSQHDSLLKGFRGNDSLRGLSGKDTLRGGRGRDRLEGGGANDLIIGGRGRDQLVYTSIQDSPVYKPDIAQFKQNDTFDFRGFDGSVNDRGKQKLRLIKEQEFSGEAGDLMVRSNGIFADINGDKLADFSVLFQKELGFTPGEANFIL